MEISMMETIREALIEQIESNYADILRKYRGVPITHVVECSQPNGWSAKDILAHIGAWEWRCASLLDESHSSDAPLQAEPDVEALNDEFYQERKSWSWEDVEQDARAAHRSLLAALRQFPPERLNEDFVQQMIVAETWEHYAEHLADLKQWHEKVE